jgi:hypothetical protein
MAFPPADPEVMYDLARGRLDSQLAAISAIDSKLAGFFGIGSALLGVVAAIYAIKPDIFKAGGWELFGMALVAYAVLSVISLAGMSLREWKTGPQMEAIYNDHIQYGEAEIKWRATSTLLRLVKKNNAAYDEKANAARWSPILVVILTALVVAAAVDVAFQG